VKTTIEIQDELMVRAKRHARRSGQPFRTVVEDGLRLVLNQSSPPDSYRLADCSVGDPDADDPLEQLSWQDLRARVYGEP
jgi:hypothetical protein